MVLKRSELKTEDTWDLDKVFESDESWEKAFDDIQRSIEQVNSLQEKISGSNFSGEQLADVFEIILDLFRKFEKVYVYASMKNDQDTGNSKYLGFNNKVSALAAKVSGSTAFFEPELLKISEQKLEELVKSTPRLSEYRHYFDSINKKRKYLLSPENEKILAGASDIFGASQNTFGILDNADLKFGKVEQENGETVELTNGLYGILLESTDGKIRKQAFETLYKSYITFKNTFASTLSSHIKGHNYLATVHNYQSAKQKSLLANDIPEVVFDNLITEVQKHLPLLHEYVSLRKQILKLNEVHSYDLYTPIVGEVDNKYSFEDGKKIVLEALKPLGQDYLSHVKTAMDERWIDVYENEGKRSGAYSGGAYDTPAYILLNWQDNLDNVSTLAHEMGHSIHSYYTRSNQPYAFGDYPIFLAEIASTTNEGLLTNYLLEQSTDKKFRAYILNQFLDGFKGTVFRQTQFAEFEDWIHQQDQKGIPLTADSMSEYYAELNQKYYGPDLTKDAQIAYEWERIPHFYYNYYVYQYATGQAASIALVQNILSDPTNVEKYVNYLKAGSSDYPIEVMKKAGIDMMKTDYLTDAFDVFEARLNELKSLLNE